jgi:hypothetical protein
MIQGPCETLQEPGIPAHMQIKVAISTMLSEAMELDYRYRGSM